MILERLDNVFAYLALDREDMQTLTVALEYTAAMTQSDQKRVYAALGQTLSIICQVMDGHLKPGTPEGRNEEAVAS